MGYWKQLNQFGWQGLKLTQILAVKVLLIMSKVPSPYCIETISGTLQLSKGAYLTMMKRKNSTIKTLCKSKQISHSNNLKATMKKSKKMYASVNQQNINSIRSSYGSRSYSRQMIKNGKMGKSLKTSSCVRNNIQLWDKNKNHMQEFQVWDDRDLFNIKGIPLIEMEGDNDDQSTWEQVWEHGKGMTMALSMAAYDKTYGN